MQSLVPVDRVEIHVVLDNVTDGLSTVSPHAESEFAGLARRGARELAGEYLCCACHGLSYFITASRGGLQHTVLFDSGPEEFAFARNVQMLGLDMGMIESVVLSHGHWDHSGGMLKALDLMGSRNGGALVPFYAHPGMFRSRARRLPNGQMWPMKDVPGVEVLRAHGAQVVNSAGRMVLLDGMFCVSGEIPRITLFEQGLADHYQRTADGQEWKPDPWIMDERSLMIHVKDRGLLVFTACSHAGVINILQHVRASYPQVPVFAVMGGFHLAGPNEHLIPKTVEAMAAFHLQFIAAGHCTGWRAMSALTQVFGDAVMDPAVVGKRFIF